MFYNAKAGRFGIEKIGMAVSRDMIHWKRFGENCVVENEIEDRWNIAGDPQVIRFEDLWVNTILLLAMEWPMTHLPARKTLSTGQNGTVSLS